jgi:hypothetical protein
MNMKTFSMNRFSVLAFGATLALLGSVSEVLALDNNSENSTDVWPAEGNVRCSDYFDNSVVREASTSNLVGDALPDGSGATGSYNPLDPADDPDYTNDEVVDFTVVKNDAGAPIAISNFGASTRINAVILKAGRHVNLFIEPAGGVTMDSNLALENGEPISAVSFCYGITYSEPVVSDEPIPSCEIAGDYDQCESGEAFECDLSVTTGIVNGEEVETGTKVSCCACDPDDAGVQVCNPQLPLGTDGACDFAIKSFNQILFGLNGRVVCYQTDSGERCFEYTR